MQFIYILTLNQQYHDLKNWTEEANEVMAKHFEYLKNQYEKGVMKHVGRTDLDFGDENLHGYAVFECDNPESAKVIMEADPAVSGKLMSAVLLPYKIVFG